MLQQNIYQTDITKTLYLQYFKLKLKIYLAKYKHNTDSSIFNVYFENNRGSNQRTTRFCMSFLTVFSVSVGCCDANRSRVEKKFLHFLTFSTSA